MYIELERGDYVQRFKSTRRAEALMKELTRLGISWHFTIPAGKIHVAYYVNEKAIEQMEREEQLQAFGARHGTLRALHRATR
jgi:hypothetical protein